MTLKNVNKNNQFYNRIMWKICHNLHVKKISKLFSLAGMTFQSNKPVTWEKVFKNGPSKICGRQPLNYLKGYMGQSIQEWTK